MGSSSEFINGKEGDTICRPAKWTDVVKFFLLNYVLHALTVIQSPGSSTLPAVSSAFTALVLPFSGIANALVIIYGFARGGQTPLQTALRAGALCTVVPSKDSEGLPLRVVSPRVSQVHGQHPVPPNLIDMCDKERNRPQVQYRLVVVPEWFTVKPLLTPHPEYPCEPQLSCNYSILKATAAIAQIIYGSFELYNARGHQAERFGYAAYSLTVIPYILMSLANLIATLCTPQYPSMFIVLYRGTKEGSSTREGRMASQQEGPERAGSTAGEGQQQEGSKSTASETGGGQQTELENVISPIIGGLLQDSNLIGSSTRDGQQEEPKSVTGVAGKKKEKKLGGWAIEELQEIEAMTSGAVGEAYGEFQEPPDLLLRPIWRLFLLGLFFCIGATLLATPFIIIKLLTNFENGQSSRIQRSWIMIWLVIGQWYGAMLSYMKLSAFLLTAAPKTKAKAPKTKADIYSSRAIDVYASLAIDSYPNRAQAELNKLIFALVTSFGAVGGSVVVAKMILDDGVCTAV